MNRHPQKISGAQRGSALLAALCFCAVLGIALASYMGVCTQTLQLSNRNSQGTHSLELAENGMEEALWALNKNDWTGWTFDNVHDPKVATKTVDGFAFGNNVTGSVALTVENYDGNSSLTDYAQSLRKLKVVGQTMLADGTTVTRKLQASAQRAPLFVNALAATSASNGSSTGRTGVSFIAGGKVDSFDSTRNGAYGDLDGDGIPNVKDSDMDGDGIPNVDDDDIDGDGLPNEFDEDPYGSTAFSAVLSSASSVALTDAWVDGYVATPADPNGNARISYSNIAHLAGPNTAMSTSIDSTRISTSPYQPVFDIKTVSEIETITGLGTTLPAGNASIGDPTATVPTLYLATDVILTDSQTLTVNGPIILVITGSLKIQDTAQIVVTNTFDGAGALVGTGSIQIVLSGTASELLIAGHGIQNDTNRPKNVAIFDAATSSYNNPEISTTADFYGVVYAPNSNRELIVSSNLKFYGSLVAKNVTISGSPSIHYDVDLRRITTKVYAMDKVCPTDKFSAIETPFVISAWQEITTP